MIRGRLRVLFSCRSYVGHVRPMLPLGRALLEAGHEVAVASGPTAGAQAQRAGLGFFAAGPDQMTPGEREALFPESVALAPSEIRSFFFGRVFSGHELPLRAADLGQIVDRFKPAVLVHEVAEFAGPLVAFTRGLPYATHSYGPVIAEDAVAAAADGARPHWEAAGVAAHPRAGLWEHLYLDVCPPSIQRGDPLGAPKVQPIRPAERSARWTAADRSLVYVTMGTVYSTNPSVFRTILDGLAGEDLEVIVTVGEHGDPDALGDQPDNVRVERFIPQEEILSSCSAVIMHGGAGSMLGALAFGCPLLVIPQGADQFANARGVSVAGAGIALAPDQVSREAIRDAVRRLIDETGYVSAAQRISDEIAAMPPPAAAVATLEELALAA